MRNEESERKSQRCEESEKWLEQYLTRLVKSHGGISLKYASHTQTGYPDRVILMPGGVTGWVELKSRGKHPTKLQAERINRMRALGHKVWVADSPLIVEQAVRILAEASSLTTTSGGR